MNIQTIAIIGNGRFGKLLQYILPKIFQDAKIIVFLRSTDISIIETCDLVIPAVPIRAFKEVMQSISPHLGPDSIVMDVCSVKVYPKKIMQQVLPKTVRIVATHPMFGPGTLEKSEGSLVGLSLVIEPVRIDATSYLQIKQAFTRVKLNVIEMDADTHDRYAAVFHFTAQYMASFLKELDIKRTPIDTKSVDFLHGFTSIVKNDSIILLQDMFRYNQYCKKQLSAIQKASEKINNLIAK